MEASGWAVDLYRRLFGADHDPSEIVLERIDHAIADARAAGYAEAKEQAADIADRRQEQAMRARDAYEADYVGDAAREIADAIRALELATTKETT